jgi:hypothetical protein
MNAETLLLSRAEIQSALGPGIHLNDSNRGSQVQALGSVIGAAAIDTAFRAVRGLYAGDGGEGVLAVGMMALVFDSEQRAATTFNSVGEAAHLRTKVGDSLVAVETVTAQSGLVSYWGYIQHGPAILVLTLDTLDPQRISMSDFRALVTHAAARLERASRLTSQ